MSVGYGRCLIAHGTFITKCRGVSPCKVLDKIGPTFKLDDKKFFVSYINVSLTDDEGSGIVNVIVSYRKGTFSITPQPVLGKIDYQKVFELANSFINDIKSYLIKNHGAEEIGELYEKEELQDGTINFKGFVGFRLGFHGSYSFDYHTSLYDIANLACSADNMKLNEVGWSAKSKCNKIKSRRSYDVLTFIVKRRQIVMKGNWSKKEASVLIEKIKDVTGADVVSNY